MDYQQLINSMTPAVYERLVLAVEIGKWPDGSALSQEQKSTCMEAVLTYQVKHLPRDQQAGYIAQSCRPSKGVEEGMGSNQVTADVQTLTIE